MCPPARTPPRDIHPSCVRRSIPPPFRIFFQFHYSYAITLATTVPMQCTPRNAKPQGLRAVRNSANDQFLSLDRNQALPLAGIDTASGVIQKRPSGRKRRHQETTFGPSGSQYTALPQSRPAPIKILLPSGNASPCPKACNRPSTEARACPCTEACNRPGPEARA